MTSAINSTTTKSILESNAGQMTPNVSPTLLTLPKELTSKILSYLELNDLARTGTSCRTIYVADIQPSFVLRLKKLSSLAKELANGNSNNSWMFCYIDKILNELMLMEIDKSSRLKNLVNRCQSEIKKLDQHITLEQANEAIIQMQTIKANLFAISGNIQEALAEIQSIKSTYNEEEEEDGDDKIYKDRALFEVIQIIAEKDIDKALLLTNNLENQTLIEKINQKLCLVLARNNRIKESLHIAQKLNELKYETIRLICVLIAQRDIDFSLKLVNENLKEGSFDFLESHKQILEIFISSLIEKSLNECDIISEVLKFIKSLKASSSLKIIEVFLKDTCEIFAKKIHIDSSNISLSLRFADEIKNEFNKLLAIKLTIKSLMNLDRIEDSVSIATSRKRNEETDALLKFICINMHEEQKNRDKITEIANQISDERIKRKVLEIIFNM